MSYGNLRTEQEFEDFNLKLEVNVPEGNSGVYLRGMRSRCSILTKSRSTRTI
ncbi:MAG: DUF1080 domain-containing protein [Saprospiraceae bacterium]|nr:DUF1080 domain-containing protein [Saprospiraceae bacterium]